jgi:hypothetical protein
MLAAAMFSGGMPAGTKHLPYGKCFAMPFHPLALVQTCEWDVKAVAIPTVRICTAPQAGSGTSIHCTGITRFRYCDNLPYGPAHARNDFSTGTRT